MNKNLRAWLLYDAGNSFIVSATGGLFLAQWFVLDKGIPEAWYGFAFSAATVFVLLSSPIIGAWSDTLGYRKPFINFFTIALLLAGSLMIFTTNVAGFGNLFPLLTLLLFFFVQYTYQLSFLFFNTLLEKLSSKQTLARISGLSTLYNQIAYVLANAILLLFAMGKITLIGIPGRSQVFLPAVVICTIFSLPLILQFQEKRTVKEGSTRQTSALAETIGGIRMLFKKERNVGVFLLGFSFVSDALLTISLYFALVMNELYRMSDVQKLIAISLMYVCAGLIGALLGKVAGRFGMKRSLLFMALMLTGSFTVALLGSNFSVLLVTLIFAGIGWGGFYSLTRAMLIRIAPPARLGEYFGFYSTFERFASIIGPTIWGVIVTWLAVTGGFRYRIAGITEVVLMVIGIVLLSKVKVSRSYGKL
ncbi:hypothetical protein A3A79_05370 [Candidatus Gottesmanbacteria bacterium RIFCSPLOWO2_01_FULL_43_11b]|uniref:Major facilitator superfamily (MFS) profile domain-containing protein n=1 Tax=Candidatus Gottesmanbacteria bacterium RIFCSPLOWO2_01_FULL_43_11b TaxID=1798392 RepID=A0A1F6AIN1_9BACT|nr:MAG: hypothetical protein A3A79_05370 [Candidatus Gottesmanbacteria bacterium RIFCSPLOWO2_01_FULL_43_11b]